MVLVGPYFLTRRGLGQGDPLSPVRFDISADVLATLIMRATEQDNIKGLI
jgi:hypothetical protein